MRAFEFFSMRSELENWHDWTSPDFFVPDRTSETNVVRLFARQLLPSHTFSQKTKLTLIGWFLILVSLGIGSAAYNTSSNILFMTLSLMLSSLVLSGILSLINFKKLDWRLKSPSHLRVGEIGMAEIALENRKSVFPSMGLCFQVRSPLADGFERLYLPHGLAAGARMPLEWSFSPNNRGIFRVEIAGIESLFPFGFIRKSIHSDVSAETLVWPARVAYAFKTSPGGQRHFSGVSRRKPGLGSDLLNIRPYQRGDTPRLIDWRATARTGELMVRQLAQEGESGYCIAIDVDSDIWSQPAFERLCSLACSLGDDLFHFGRLDAYQIGTADAVGIRGIRDLHEFFDNLALLQRESEGESKHHLIGLKNVITFRPSGDGSISIYVDQDKAGEIIN